MFHHKNGFLLKDALFAFFIIILSITLLTGILSLYRKAGGFYIHEQIEKKWFYDD